MNLAELKRHFREDEIEWRVSRSGEKNGKIWAKVLAYITNRAIMDRLDEVCGPENWKNEFREAPGGGVLCGISINAIVNPPSGLDRAWITKWDGAEQTAFEATKGGLSGAMKRAAVQWGIGRYLYNLPEGWAQIVESGGNSAKTKEGIWFHWIPPELPSWALPPKVDKIVESSEDGSTMTITATRGVSESPERPQIEPQSDAKPVGIAEVEKVFKKPVESKRSFPR